MIFDAVVGNPPFQNSKHKNKAHPLWMRFYALSLELADVIAMVLPKTVYWKFPKHNIKYISPADHYFREIHTLICFVIASKQWRLNNTIVSNKHTIPTDGIWGLSLTAESVEKLTKIWQHTVPLLFSKAPWRPNSKTVSKTKDKIHKYPLFHTNTQILYSSIPYTYQHTPKVILPRGGAWMPFYSDTMGITHINFAIQTTEPKKLLKKLHSNIVYWYFAELNFFGSRTKDMMLHLPILPHL